MNTHILPAHYVSQPEPPSGHPAILTETMVRTNLPKQRLPFYQGDDQTQIPETFPSVSDTIPAMGELFSDAGYRCVHFGKTHDYGALKGFEVIPSNEIPKERTNPAIKFDYETFLDIDTTEKTVSWLKTEGAQTTQPFLAVARSPEST